MNIKGLIGIQLTMMKENDRKKIFSSLGKVVEQNNKISKHKFSIPGFRLQQVP